MGPRGQRLSGRRRGSYPARHGRVRLHPDLDRRDGRRPRPRSPTKQGVQARGRDRVGDWDVLLHARGPISARSRTPWSAEFHSVPGVDRTLTAPVVPADRIGLTGFGGPKPPPIVPNACYVHLRVKAGQAPREHRRALRRAPRGRWRRRPRRRVGPARVRAQPWEIASGVILEQIHAIAGIVATSTLVSIDYEERDEDRDQFSAWS